MQDDNPQRETVTAEAPDTGARLDRFLSERLADMSRSRLQALIRAGEVSLNGRQVADPGHRLKAGDAIVVTVPPPEPAKPQAQAIPLTIVYEDAHLIVIDKPRGLTVHPAPGHASGTLVNALIAHCGASLSGIGGVKRPGIVHRLDKDTTGLLVAAKTDRAHRGLSEQFAPTAPTAPSSAPTRRSSGVRRSAPVAPLTRRLPAATPTAPRSPWWRKAAAGTR